MHPSSLSRGAAWSKVLAPLACAALIACGSKPPPPPPAPPPPPPPTVVEARFVTTAAPNPDPNGRPLPVVVRVYELKSTAAFDSADFFSLWDKDQGTLGPEMISRDEYSMTPNEEKKFE